MLGHRAVSISKNDFSRTDTPKVLQSDFVNFVE
jgi:hypothetical protein